MAFEALRQNGRERDGAYSVCVWFDILKREKDIAYVLGLIYKREREREREGVYVCERCKYENCGQCYKCYMIVYYDASTILQSVLL